VTWTKLSDDFSDDCWTLSDAGYRLHIDGLIWSNRKLLDCRIPKDDVPRFAKRPEAIQELLDTGWWAKDDQHYLIRHHAGYQRTREQVLKQQAVNQKNGKQGGKAKAAREQADDISPSDSLTEPPSDSLSERDRTGLDGLRTGLQAQQSTEVRAAS
jgi:hypothetical protein